MQHNVVAQLQDAAIAAGLAHELSWAQVGRILGGLPVEDGCPYCGGYLQPWHIETDCFRCAGCGKLHTRGIDAWRLDFDDFHRREWAAKVRPWGKQGLDDTSRDAGSIPARSTIQIEEVNWQPRRRAS